MLLKNEYHAKIRNINLSYDIVVVGSSLEALTYSYLNNLPILYTRLSKPHLLDRFSSDQDLSCFGIENKNIILHSNKDSVNVGIEKIYLWEKLYFNLSLAGLIPLECKCASLRLENDILKASTNKARMAKIKFNKLIIFDDYLFSGLGLCNISKNKVEVYDWFSVKSGMKHEYDIIYGEDDFVNKIYFYQSDRIDGNHLYKDAISYSILDEDQMDDFEYSDINARFKTVYLMKNAGIKGTRNGKDTLNKNRYKYYAVRIENFKREIIKPKNIYKNKDNLIFIYDSFYDIMNKNKIKESYVSRILQR